MAARARLLGDLQSVLGLARRRYGYLLTDTKRQWQDGETAIFQAFSILRARVQRCENLSDLTPALVLRPFLDLVRHEQTSSSLTSAALEAVRNLLDTWPWDTTRDPSAVSDAVSDIVDAVSQCRFQETSAESDENVIVLVVGVLHAVLMSHAAPFLSDHSMWQLVESLYALSRAPRSDRHITHSMRATATSFLHDAIKFIFTSPSVYADASSPPPLSVGFGLPCAVKAMGFLCQKLHQRSGGSSPSASRREVLLALGLLHSALLACDAHAITRVPALMLFIKDDLCSGLLRFARLGACSEPKIPLRCLEIVRLLWTKLRAVLKMQLEALLNGVFCNALHWTIACLDVASPNFPGTGMSRSGGTKSILPGAAAGSAAPSDAIRGSSGRRVDAALDEFTGELAPLTRLFTTSFELLECLVDLLAEPALLPDLYVNYDCDGNRSDLTLNVFELLAHVAQQSHSACRETNDEAHFRWAQAIGELALRGLFNALYVVYLRSQHRQPKALDSTALSDDNSSNDDDDGLLDDRSMSPRGGPQSAGFASAEALYRRRQRKKFFQHGIAEFNRKPLAGIKYLQQHAFLPTPLDAASLAAFLRSLPPGLHKSAVGAYLGAMGKDVKDFERSDIHAADTIEFHRDVLARFVQSFNFDGESVVAALRMFLASFRLPGEAQQIDRILNTFSLQVFAQCRDRCLMASPDVAYLLSFSLIMLNTDLHNANIRAEKKMSRADFVRNNRNYGTDVSRGQDLPDDFLHALYDAIAQDEIKTFEDGGKHGEVTSDRWKDLLHQAETDPRNSRLIVHHSHSHRRHSDHEHHSNGERQSRCRASARSVRSFHDGSDSFDGDADERARVGSMTTHSDAFASDQYDRHIFELIQTHLVRAFASVFDQFVRVANSQHRGDDDDGDASDGSDPFALDASGGSVSGAVQQYVPEKSMLQLACNGLVLCAGAASHLALPDHLNAVFTRVCKYTALFASEVYPRSYSRRADGVWRFCSNPSAPVATAGMLKLVGTCSLSLRSASWACFFHALSTLREFQALPPRLLRRTDMAQLTTEHERAEFVDLVYETKDAMQRREDAARQAAAVAATTASPTGGFFSGMAWLMSAFETHSSSAYAGGGGSQRESHLPDDELPSNPVEWSEFAQDLVIEMLRDDNGDDDDDGDDDAQFGTEAWIRSTLAPYRLELLVQDVFRLPPRALVEVVRALDDELLRALGGSPRATLSALPHALAASHVPMNGRRRSSKKLRASEDDSASHEPVSDVQRTLSPAGCVLFEHFLSQIVSQSNSVIVRDCGDTNDDDDDDDEGVCRILEAHYAHLLAALVPMLASTSDVTASEATTASKPAMRRLSYENACFVVAKAIDGVFALALQSPSARSRALLTSVVVTLVDASSDDELVRPFLCQLLAGLERCFASAPPPVALQYTRAQWLVVTNLISWSVETALAASHGFALLEHLVRAQVWRVDASAISISDCYTKALLFALVRSSSGESAAAMSPVRALQLLCAMFAQLGSEPSLGDSDEQLALRFVGGFLLACRELVKANDGDIDSGENAGASSQSLNETIATSLALVQELLVGASSHSKSLFSASAWLAILQHGILPLGFDVLHGGTVPASSVAAAESGASAEHGILYYAQQFTDPSTEPSPVKRGGRSQHQQQPQRRAASRRRRPSVVKDPFALRPHVLMVQLLSAIVCEELSVLVQCAQFAGVWDDVVDLLIGLLRHTELESSDNGSGSGATAGGDALSGDLVLAALERRSVLSAHEEILEHVKGITRRLAALELDARSAVLPASASGGLSNASSAYMALVRVLVAKCEPVPGLVEQIFPSPDDSGSSGELTPPLLEGDGEGDDDDGDESDAADEAA